ncbi:MAG: MBL fold metallo-hydrolase [Promethearchaeota archaeon]
MKIVPVAFDSFGVRSMSTLVITKSHRILIDPGVALGPRRYGLPPTQPELVALELAKQRVMKSAEDADTIVITHYHYDHHPRPGDDKLYQIAFKDKLVFAKDRKRNVNVSQRRRGLIFEKKVADICKELVYADGQDFDFIRFSPAVWHGTVGSRVGFVIMVCIPEGEHRFIHGSDTQSLGDPKAMNWVVEENPDLLIADGFPTTYIGKRTTMAEFENASKNLVRTIKAVRSNRIVLDHHIARDIDYRKRIGPLLRAGKPILTAAEFLGRENLLLEAWREDLHHKKKEVDVQAYFERLEF